MERKGYDLARMLRESIPCDDCSMDTDNSNAVIPKCINTDFCVNTPESRNGVLTMAFVDMQPLESVYPEETAFSSGTLFPNLDKPFFIGGMKR